ncbi:hypothetical protein GCM10027589_21580 [Actinocorallia lasiicapitis]
MIDVRATDYGWVDDDDGDFPAEYCLTLVRGMSGAEFLRTIGARPGPTVTGLETLSEELWPENDRDMPIAVTELAGWAIGLEINGFLGVSEKVYVPLSAGTRFVSHFCNVNAVSKFVWVEDGELRLGFDPLFADSRYGTTPDALTDVMTAIGFVTTEREDDADDFGAVIDGAFALTEHLTGVRITEDFLSNATYECGVVKDF